MKNSPNWNNAPQWAQYWAVDPDGRAFWYERKPSDFNDLFCNGTNVSGWYCEQDGRIKIDDRDAIGYSDCWTKTLQQRPTNTLPANGPKEPEYFKVAKGRNYLTGWPDTGF